MKNLGLVKPCLKAHSLVIDGARMILENESHTRQVSLATDQKPILELINGENSIRDIVEKQLANTGKVTFRAIFSLLQSLDEAKLLVDPLGLNETKSSGNAPLERNEVFFMRPLFEIVLLRHLNLRGLYSPFLLLLAAAAVVGISADTCLYWINHFSTRGFFILPEANGFASYRQAIPAFFIAASLLMTFKGMAKALLMLVSTGHVYHLRLRLHLFGLSVGASDISTHGLTQLWLLIYFLTCAMLYIFAAAVLPSYVASPSIVHSFEALAILMTFIDLDAYRRSDLTLLIDRFFRDGDSRRLTAYLKNRALFSAASGGKGFGGEARLVVYSTLALLWTVGFSLFALDLLSTNYPNLVLATMSAPTLSEKASAGGLLLILIAMFGALFFDLASTIASNILFPLLTPYLRLLQKMHSSEVTDYNKTELLAALRKISFFEDLAEGPLQQVCNSGRLKQFSRGTRLIIQGDPGKELFVLLNGSVNVLKRDETGLQSQVCTLGSNSVFGEIALIKDCVRTADVVANENIRVLVIEKEAFRTLLGAAGTIASDYERILERIALGHYLASTSLFREMPAEGLGVFRELGQFEKHSDGDVIIREGETDRSFFMVLRGSLAVSKGGVKVAQLKQGDFFGEIALLGNVARTATVTCTDQCLLLKLESTAYWRVLSENLALAMTLEMVAESRSTVTGA